MDLQDQLIRAIDAHYGVYTGGGFSCGRWEQWVERRGIPWPRDRYGLLNLDDDTFRDMARTYPDVAPMRQLRKSLDQLHALNLPIGADGRNRCSLRPFSSVTGRNQPSTREFIFWLCSWLRGLIMPEPGRALALLDYRQQEFGIGAALSEDSAMQAAYRTGDPYLTFGKQAGLIPSDATRESHPGERERFKACLLGVQYGMGHGSLAKKVGGPPWLGRELLELHQRTYREFWEWSDAVENHALLHRRLRSAFGWDIYVGQEPNTRSLRNFPLSGQRSRDVEPGVLAGH